MLQDLIRNQVDSILPNLSEDMIIVALEPGTEAPFENYFVNNVLPKARKPVLITGISNRTPVNYLLARVTRMSDASYYQNFVEQATKFNLTNIICQ